MQQEVVCATLGLDATKAGVNKIQIKDTDDRDENEQKDKEDRHMKIQ